ncbi:MAG: hypothetical protein ABJA71_03505 [Ginsengibacter sp.]
MKEIQLSFDAELSPLKKMNAGNISCFYEAGNLRYIKSRDTEILRRIYSAVRDENWETIPATISGEKIEEYENGFSIKYTALYKTGAIHYRADFSIEGNTDNSIVFSMKGEALSNFKKNRIGLCVLHPIKEYAGRRVSITQTDGSIYKTVFPELISPHQPFLNIRQMNWALDNGIDVQLNFEGDIFETEDQRNWTDSSYKTYSTPLDLPFPALVKAGEKIEQRITLHVTGNIKQGENNTTPRIYEEKISFPKIGYCRSNNQQSLTNEHVEILNQIPFDHYRVELQLYESSWQNVLLTAATEARLLQTKLELVTFFDDEYEQIFDEFILHLEPVKDFISCILLLHRNSKITPQVLMQKGYAIIKQRFPVIEIGYGTDGHFAELNRNLPQLISYDFVSFSLNPQAHAGDTRTLFENLERQADTVKTLKAGIGSKEIRVSPITLKKRKHSGAVSTTEQSMTIADERQHTVFTAFWTLRCIQNLSEAGHVTFYELMGDAGIISEKKPSPVYDVLKMIKKFDAKWIIKRYEGQNLATDNVIVENANGERMIFKCFIVVEA